MHWIKNHPQWAAFVAGAVLLCAGPPQVAAATLSAGGDVNQTGTAALALNTDSPCFTVGAQVVVTVDLSGAAVPIVAGQFFLIYDNTTIEFVDAQPGDAPFTVELAQAVNPVAGTLDYAVSVPTGAPGTMNDTTMARIHFTAIRDACVASPNLVAFRPHAPPTRLSDEFGGEVLPALTNLVLAQGPPQVQNLTVSGGSVDGNCQLQVAISATVTDECCVNAASVSASAAITTGNANWTSNLTISQINPTTVQVAGTVMVSALTGCPATLQVTIQATDCCGFGATPAVQTSNVIDDTPPQLASCPGDMTVTPAAGECDAVVSFGPLVAVDNCDPAPSVECNHDSGETFPGGITAVTCEVRDDCGNETPCAFNVTVNEFNELLAEVEYDGVLAAGPINRCIRFELWNCAIDDEAPIAVVDDELTFTDGWTLEPVEVPCGEYTCVTARDMHHTLRRTIDPIDVTGGGASYAAAFADAAGLDLIGGNLNDSVRIDILDFGVFISLWGTNYGTGNIPCGTPAPHADVTGDGRVDNLEFSFILINFLEERAPNCCGAPGQPAAAGEPLTRISVKELYRRGLGELTVADLNGDGWVDDADMAAFAQGARPMPQPTRADKADGRAPRGRMPGAASEE